MDAFPEVVEAAKKYPMVNYIPAAELTVHSPKGSFDMVCLGLPQVPTPELQQVFAAYHNWQRSYGDAYCALLCFEGYYYSRADRKMLLQRYRPQKTIEVQGITHVQNGVQNDFLINAFGNGMTLLYHPQDLFITGFTPFQCTGGSSTELAENLGSMTGVQNNQTHAVDNSLVYAVYDFIRYIPVFHVTPPEQNVGVIENFVGQTVLRHFQRCGFYVKPIFT